MVHCYPMKNVKVSDEVHAELGNQSQSAGITMSKLIEGLLSGSGILVKSNPLERLADQQELMWKVLDEINGKLDSPKIFSENSVVSEPVIAETSAEKAERVRREHQEMLKFQKHEINHPEDVDQTRDW